MKTLVLGDIHGRTCWKDIITKENPDRTIFLGDYVASHESINGEQQINNLISILEFKEENSDSVILLRGNHDVQHLVGDDMTCCYNHKVGRWMYDNKERFMNNTQWVLEEGDIIFSHAGISQTWYDNHKYDSIASINEDNNLINFEFTPCKMSDYYGDSATQPPTWIRPSALLSYGIPNKTYIVGHTSPNKHICELNEEIQKNFPEVAENFNRNIKVWLCDKLPKEYLIIEDNEFVVKNVNIFFDQEVYVVFNG